MNSFIEFIMYRLTHLGEIPICNGVASRAPHFFGICFPLCYRCTFIFLLFFVALYIGHRYRKNYHFGILLLCMLPMIIDGCLQTFWGLESTNLRRAITGGIFGFSLGMVVNRVYQYIDQRL